MVFEFQKTLALESEAKCGRQEYGSRKVSQRV